MSSTIYDKVINGVRYTPGHQTMIRVKNPKGQIVASIQVNGTWGASACDPDSDDPKIVTGNEYTLDVDHQKWQPVAEFCPDCGADLLPPVDDPNAVQVCEICGAEVSGEGEGISVGDGFRLGERVQHNGVIGVVGPLQDSVRPLSPQHVVPVHWPLWDRWERPEDLQRMPRQSEKL